MRPVAMAKCLAAIGLIGCIVYFVILFISVHGSIHRKKNITGEYSGPWWRGSTKLSQDKPLLYNRVPKCGSQLMVLLLKWLQAYNNFKHITLPNGHLRQLNEENQNEIVNEIKDNTQNEVVPVSFDRHLYFIDFRKFGHEMPLYVNLLRDPVEKVISRYFYHHIGYTKEYKKEFNITIEEWKRKFFEDCVDNEDPLCKFIPGQVYDLSIPYFCGHNPKCMILNDSWALEEAKNNLDEHFVVVGVLELLNETMAVLEDKLPQYFSGMSYMFYNELVVPKMNKNFERPHDISEDLRRRIKANLTMEYELYDYAKERLINQFAQIKPKMLKAHSDTSEKLKSMQIK